jgi:N-acetyltransferase
LQPGFLPGFFMWIQEPVILEGENVKLIPLEAKDFAALEQVAVSSEKIWEFFPFDCSQPGALQEYLHHMTDKMQKGEWYTFVVWDKINNKISGTTSYLGMEQEHAKLEIGWTWYHPDYWGTRHNTECKFLLLQHCFETLGTTRVSFGTSQQNIRSQKAIQKIGGKLECVCRKFTIRRGEERTSYLFSIIDDEWPEVKQMLINNLKQ